MIHLLFTGGTISMRQSAEAGGAVPALDGAALVRLAPGLASVGPVTVEDWGRFPAPHLGLDRLWALRNRLTEVAASGSVRGIVVTHGTDTLEETAYLLARTLDPAIPVVLTGAMRTSEEEEWDGRRNLVDSARVAGASESRGRGTMVVLHGTVLSGLEALKTDAGEVDTFRAPRGAPLGVVAGGSVRFTAGGRPAAPLPRWPGTLSARIAMVPAVVGDTGAMVDAARDGHDGLVVVGFGRGNLPPAMAGAAERWLAAGKPVVLATRCFKGEVLPIYAYEGGGARLLQAGAIAAGPRAPSQAWMELVVTHSAGLPFGAGMEA
ncbi:MAG TPA: asparaginase [Gemmatimonadales bacterium]|nr:asparaginase [Gemmatimonadales bacterium]HRZ09367.1 asparaginase [Gemmatimonadales bacterium]